jgi:hypothetical protein
MVAPQYDKGCHGTVQAREARPPPLPVADSVVAAPGAGPEPGLPATPSPAGGVVTAASAGPLGQLGPPAEAGPEPGLLALPGVDTYTNT